MDGHQQSLSGVMKILLAVVIVALFGFAGGAAGWLIAFTTDDCSAAADRLDAMFRGVGVTEM